MGPFIHSMTPPTSLSIPPAPDLLPKNHSQSPSKAAHFFNFAAFHRPKVALRGAL
jgi:hypothetical protein